MSNDIPSPPIIYNIYHSFRSLLTPNQNGIYLLGESMVLGLLISVLLYTYLLEHILVCIILIMSLLLVSSTSHIWTESDMYHIEYKLLRITFKRFIVIFTIGLIPIILFYLLTYTYNLLSITIVFIYALSIYWRSKKYIKERVMYINKHSELYNTWYMASVCMEKGIENLDKNNKYRSFYWFKQAQEKYDYINKYEKRKSLKIGANELMNSAMLFSVLTFADKLDYELYHKEAYDSIKRANKNFATRFCDSCNIRKKIEYTTLFIEESNPNKIYCNYCYSNFNNHTNEEYNNYTKKKHTDPDMNVTDALNILNINKPLNKSKIKKAYRTRVKETHPDVGGSVQEFKDTKKAKKTLLSYIKK